MAKGMAAAMVLCGSMALGAGAAAAPRVAVDIGPAHAVAARVMAGVGAPGLLMRPGASPHGYAMRPSEARALQSAQLVIWVGPSLTPWLEDAVETLGGDAAQLRLSDVPGAARLPVRTGAAFPAHAHGEEHDDEGHEDHAHDDHSHDDHAHDAGHGDHDEHGKHADHADDDHADANQVGHAGEGHDGRAAHEEHGAHVAHAAHDHAAQDDHDDHGHAALGFDPHMWLDPMNAAAWAEAMAEALAEADPANAAAYHANAAGARAEYVALAAEVAETLAPVRGRSYLVFHDAYQYFESRFDMPAAGAVSVSEATSPGAARVAEAREVVRTSGAVCVFSEPQFEPALVATVIEGSDARAGVLDPIGAQLEPGAGMYPALIRRLAAGMVDCLSAAM
ncbi:zinc ABC transporter substrate-binding protein [Rubrimonas cliftonensis]|uniref:High-affinity zinc uptake system protein ZnuA n=1 Tax=Rubrimonas cliftonensis TaxID=89524 RepID=A0A1H3W290_9RHOB|nr:zinc ABC transporter substrate-binding protein [Rubrimonas cliftonensis]SDZ81227.1 zinc transport system substrate-binding protein [Rubrimonas cliftonensis]